MGHGDKETKRSLNLMGEIIDYQSRELQNCERF